MSLLPDRRDGASRNQELAAREARKTELQVFRYQLGSRAKGQMVQADSEALGDSLRLALTEEVTTLEYGLRLANGDPAIIELTARKVAMQEAIDNRNISQVFRGRG